MLSDPPLKTSALFRHIEQLQGEAPWGAFLDAGTGVNSALWSTALPTERWCAVTGSPGHAAQVQDRAGGRFRSQDRLIVGNWTDPDMLAGEGFDTVLADYLVDGLAETDQGFELTCSPAWEASNYAAQAHNPWRPLRRYPGAIRVLKAESGSLCAVPTTRRAASPLQVETVAGGGHLFPMTHADVARDALLDLAV